ncbi:MAG: phosphoribosylglycinamide formyltransferase-1 [Cocleimonas sp.]|jgi:phosphoribosylglycinamide formyltransferase-1
MYKIVVLISGGGSNLQAIIDNIQTGNIKAEISAVISNRADAYGLERAEKADIDNHVLDHTVFESRETFDQSLSQIIDSYEPNLIVLAGFMRILSDGFVEHFRGRLINIHPSLLPKYKGLNTHQRALEGGDSEHGASVHFVIPELDAGTIIIQGIVPVETNDTVDELQQRVHQIEHQIYPQAVKYLAEDGLSLEEDKLLYKGTLLNEPFKEQLN